MPLVPDTLIEEVAQRFKVLSQPIRLELLSILHERGALNVQDLVKASGHRQANVSKHLLTMAEEGVLRRRKEGVRVFYEIADPSLPGLLLLVCGRLRQEDEDV